LPLILKGASSSAALTGNSAPTPVGAAALIPGPEFAIISPQEGWTVSGMLFFAAQPLDAAGVYSVTFQAGSTILGTDATPADGFKVYLDADAFPAGPLQLTATASGPCGQLTQSISVNVIPNPPAGGVVGAQGGVFASQIGSIITIPPGAVPDGTTITVTEKSQAQTTADHGIDWEAMGVTFLGAQEVQSTAPFSLPLGVASAGFGNRVQPGQAVVNYSIIPDADADGVDELVVLNTASVAPNDDVIADPVPQVLLGAASTTSSAGSSSPQSLQAGIHGPPGTVIEIKASGFNPYSALGNVAIYHSSVDGTELRVPAFVRPEFNNASERTIATAIPPLAPGSATLTLRNESTGSTAGPINITVEPAPPLSRPAAEIIDAALASALDTLSQVSSLAAEMGQPQLVDEASSAIAKTNELRSLIQQISINPTPEEALSLTNLAIMIENSGVLNNLSQIALQQAINPQGLCDDIFHPLALLGLLGGVMTELATVASFETAASALGAGLFAAAAIIGAVIVGSWVGLMIHCLLPPPPLPPPPRPPTMIPATCFFFPIPGLCPIFGMGAVMPSGGSGFGNAQTPPFTGTLRSLSAQAAGFFDQPPGRVVVKVASSAGAAFPFSGATDAGGYFFIPLIPEGEPFVATAIDTLTGQMRTFQGVGPPLGQSVPMFFDFFSGDSGGITPLHFGDVITASIDAPGEVDVYSFQASAGDAVFLRMRGLWTLGDPGCCHYPAFEIHAPDGALVCSNPPVGVNVREQACALGASGTYSLLYSDYLSVKTGAYQLHLQRLNPPAGGTPVDFGQTVTGTLDALVDLGAHTFTGAAGDRVLFRMSETSTALPLQPQFWVFGPDGTPLCDAVTNSSGTYVEKTCVLGASGAHSVLTGNWVAQYANPYALFLQRLNHPGQVIPIGLGETKSGTLEMLATADSYGFNGTSGDQVVVRMQRTAGLGFWPKLRVYRPDGSELCSAFGTLQAEVTCTLDVTGAYTILASNQQGIGSYDMTIQ
jgi:hypothetical protein